MEFCTVVFTYDKKHHRGYKPNKARRLISIVSPLETTFKTSQNTATKRHNTSINMHIVLKLNTLH